VNIVQHGHISTRKFGGEFSDYLDVHRFMDSTKLYLHHIKHRSVLHNMYGVELAVELFGDSLENSDGKAISVRDVAIAHLKEDLSGHTPSLVDWFGDAKELEIPDVPNFENKQLQEFVCRPYLRSGLQSTLFITLSDFGVELCEQVLGVESALELRRALPPKNLLKDALQNYRFEHRWQFSPCRKELAWLRENGL